MRAFASWRQKHGGAREPDTWITDDQQCGNHNDDGRPPAARHDAVKNAAIANDLDSTSRRCRPAMKP